MANKVCCDVCNRPIEGNRKWDKLKAFTAGPVLEVGIWFRKDIVGMQGHDQEDCDVCQPCGLALLGKALKRSKLELPHDD